MKQSNFWAQFSASFEQKNAYVIGKNNMALFLARVAEETKLGDVLELGCGMGTYTEILKAQADSILATDLSHQMLDMCQNRFKTDPNITFAEVDAFQLPFLDGQFDTIFMANLLHIVPHAKHIIDECKRVLKTSGKLIILDVTQHNMTHVQKIMLKYRYQKTYQKPIQKGNYPIDKKEMTDYLSHNGFIIKSSEFLGQTVKAIYIVAQKQTL